MSQNNALPPLPSALLDAINECATSVYLTPRSQTKTISALKNEIREFARAAIAAHDKQSLDTNLELHQYQEIAEHYAKCAISPEALRDWVAERMDQPTQAAGQSKPVGCVAKDGRTILYFQPEPLAFETDLYTHPAPVRQPLTCVWTEDADFEMAGTYASACGELWSFVDGGVNENKVNFCHGCGKPVYVTAQGDTQ